jgi:hypothetical protein
MKSAREETTPTSTTSTGAASSPLLRLLPWVLAVGGVSFGLAGFTVAAIVLARREPPPAAPPPLAPATSAPRPPLAASVQKPALADWQKKLFAESCETPCRGGSACPVTADNAGTANCPHGKQYCTKCTAPITCIPGSARANLERGERWQLHLSMIYEKRHGRRVPNPCGSKSDLWLCLKSSGGGDWDCVSQSDACRNAGGAAKGILVESEDLIEDGVDVQIRSGGTTGRVVAQRLGAAYGNLGRSGLCRGFRMGFDDSPGVDMFTYFLMPPQ